MLLFQALSLHEVKDTIQIVGKHDAELIVIVM